MQLLIFNQVNNYAHKRHMQTALTHTQTHAYEHMCRQQSNRNVRDFRFAFHKANNEKAVAHKKRSTDNYSFEQANWAVAKLKNRKKAYLRRCKINES